MISRMSLQCQSAYLTVLWSCVRQFFPLTLFLNLYVQDLHWHALFSGTSHCLTHSNTDNSFYLLLIKMGRAQTQYHVCITEKSGVENH